MMKSLSDLVQNPERLTRKPQSESLPPGHKATMTNLWRAMMQSFPTWQSMSGATPNQMWIESLRGYSADEIKRGVMQAIDSNLKYPPNLSEFRTLCRPPKRINAAAYILKSTPTLVHKTSDDQKKRAHDVIEQLKNAL